MEAAPKSWTASEHAEAGWNRGVPTATMIPDIGIGDEPISFERLVYLQMMEKFCPS
jgi:hypothetical protein